MSKKEEKRSTLSDLARVHSEMYETQIEDSTVMITSVLAAIKTIMSRTDILTLPGFGKFDTKFRHAYTMTSNLPDMLGQTKEIPDAYKVRFTASGVFDNIVNEYQSGKNNTNAEEAKPSE